MTRKLLFVTALSAVSLLGTSAAFAGPCLTASVGTYTAPGFSCTVGTETFSSFTVTPTTSGSGSVTLGDFSPFTFGGENGFSLAYTANTGTTAGSAADVALTYIVSSTPDMIDAYMAYAGTITGTGTTSLAETLSNGVSLSLTSPGSTTATFSPVASLSVIKDQNDFSGSAGSASSSVLENAFSTVPEPSSLILFGTALVGLGWFGQRRKRA